MSSADPVPSHKQFLTPECRDQFWKQVVEHSESISKKHLATKGNGSASWPGIRKFSKEELKEKKESYYGPRKITSVAYDPRNHYDQFFRFTEGYNNKVHRCDRRLFVDVGRNFYKEEVIRKVPVLDSVTYGRRVSGPLHTFDRIWTLRKDTTNTEHYDKKAKDELPPI